MQRLIVCRNCTESDCTYCNMNILAVALERGYFNSLMREQHTVQIDSELVPVRHGHWVENNGRYGWYCSQCKKENNYAYDYNENTEVIELQDHYCPFCGAKMDEVEDG